jgi:hypothetical protein
MVKNDNTYLHMNFNFLYHLDFTKILAVSCINKPGKRRVVLFIMKLVDRLSIDDALQLKVTLLIVMSERGGL